MSTEQPKPLSDGQRETYDFIDARLRETGFMPSIREMQEALGLASTNAVSDRLRGLERKGWMVRLPGRVRARKLMRPLVDASPDGLLARACRLSDDWTAAAGQAALRDGDGWWELVLTNGSADSEALLVVLEPAFRAACWQWSDRDGTHVYAWGSVPADGRPRPALRLVPDADELDLVAGGGS